MLSDKFSHRRERFLAAVAWIKNSFSMTWTFFIFRRRTSMVVAPLSSLHLYRHSTVCLVTVLYMYWLMYAYFRSLQMVLFNDSTEIRRNLARSTKNDFCPQNCFPLTLPKSSWTGWWEFIYELSCSSLQCSMQEGWWRGSYRDSSLSRTICKVATIPYWLYIWDHSQVVCIGRLDYNACNCFIFLCLIMPSQGPLGTRHL